MRQHTGLGAAEQAKKIWIDLDNTPHVPFFAPIMEELQSHGYSMVARLGTVFKSAN
ncbi:MAG: hypothetical protein LC114_15915 [Bryobacterales bacterium]|nr:hypothetical protein [Bryobacterales bacterium]